MLSFKSFTDNTLTEAKISAGKFSDAVDIFRRLLEKKLGTTLYRYGGKKGFAGFGKYTSILYFYGRGKAISFDYRAGEIETISLWKNYKLGKPGDYVINIKGINLVSSAYKLLDIIKDPKYGSYGIYPEIVENIQEEGELLTEAKRIAPSEFFNLVQNQYNGDMARIPWNTFADIATQNDYLVPSVVRKYKVSRGIYDLTKLVDADSDKDANKTEKQYFIKVTPYDPSSRRFLSAKEDAYAGQLLDKIQGAVERPDFKKEMKDPNTLFGHMSTLVQVLARGRIKSLLVYGGPGIGKCVLGSEKINIYTSPSIK